MKVSNISEILTYVMTSILIVFFILIIGKMVTSTFTNIEYFREVSYNGVVTLNSKKDDEVLITPNMDLSDNIVSPVSFKIMSEDNSESSMFKIDSSGVVTLLKDISGNASEGDSIKNKVVVMDGSNNKVEAELIIDVSNVVSTFVNPVENNYNENHGSYKEKNDKLTDTLGDLLKNINNSVGNLSLANSNNIGDEGESDDIVEGFTNQKGGFYYL
tara:strand:- start:1694 stop:2338 length:645 start_codon:yes stop_codon:yes gene_type:complete